MRSLLLVGLGCLASCITVVPSSPPPRASAPPPITTAIVNTAPGAASQPAGVGVATLDAAADDALYGGSTYGGSSYGGSPYAATDMTVAYGGGSYGGVTYGGPPPGGSSVHVTVSGGAPIASAPSRGRPTDPNLAATFGAAARFLESIASTHEIHGVELRYVGHASRMQAPIARHADGGFAVAVELRTPTAQNAYQVTPLLYRLDARGAVVWKTDVRPSGRFATFECGGAVVAPDGSTRVLVKTYRTPGSDSIDHLVSVSAQGTLQWDVKLRGEHGVDSPRPIVMTVDPRGELVMTGYIVRSEHVTRRGDFTDAMSRWSGRISSDGRLVEDLVGARMSADERLSPNPKTDTLWTSLYPPTPWE